MLLTPITDGFYGREFAEGRTGWTHAQYEHAAQLERDRAALIAVLEKIATRPAFSNEQQDAIADARATLATVQS